MAADLASRKCEVCVPGTPSIDQERSKQLHSEIDQQWELAETSISRRFKFKDFAEAFAFATRVALISEQEGHHPDLEVGWGYLKIKLTTHAAKGLTDNDFIMAAKFDAISS